MKDFSSYLDRAIRKEPVDWSLHYIQYSVLKETIAKFAKERKVLRKQHEDVYYAMEGGAEEEVDNDEVFRDDAQEGHGFWLQRSKDEKQEFLSILEQDLIRCADWKEEQSMFLKQQVADYASSSCKDNDQLDHLAHEFLQLFHYCVCNILSLRQILLRWNAFCRSYSSTALIDELELHRRSSQSTLRLFQLGPLSELYSSLTMQFMVAAGGNNGSSNSTDNDLEQFSTQYEQFRSLLDKSLTSMERSAAGHRVLRDQFVSSLRQWFIAGTSKISGLILEPKFLLQRGRHLKRELKVLVEWRENGVAASNATDSSSSSSYSSMDRTNLWPLILNLISCFLFMMNNYIIEPSSAYYANALGSSDALSGMMIGAAPWCALISAVAYSWWTNFSYKSPILFAGILMMIGNLLYASAYSYKSMTLCLVGRCVTGLGAPRVINRRYVADATPFRFRTAASAAFAMMTALGAALGPGMAIVLDSLPEGVEFDLPILGRQYLNGMTGPGYFMAIMWLLYSIAIVFTFHEPNRSGLDELRDREQEQENKSSSKRSLVQSSNSNVSDTATHTVDYDAMSVESSESGPSVDDSAKRAAAAEPSSSSPLYCIKHMTRAAALCMAVIFMKRIALEAIVGSTSIITKNRYSWSIQNVGTLHLVNGIIVIPVSVLAGYMSQFYADRFLAMFLLVVTIVGMIFMVDVTDLYAHDNDGYNEDLAFSVGPLRYIAGSLVAFSGIEACESFVASLMSKVVPSKLAVGTFNSGLLATLVGTSGRATGDLFITCMGLISIRNLLNLLIIPGIALMGISMALIGNNYDVLGV